MTAQPLLPRHHAGTTSRSPRLISFLAAISALAAVALLCRSSAPHSAELLELLVPQPLPASGVEVLRMRPEELVPEGRTEGLRALIEQDRELDEHQKLIDDERARILALHWAEMGSQAEADGAKNSVKKGRTEQLYLVSDDAPSEAMMDNYWNSFTDLPPSQLPGLGAAMSDVDIDRKIAQLHQESAGDCDNDDDCELLENMHEKNRQTEAAKARKTELLMAGSGLMAGDASMAGPSLMAGDGGMASSNGGQATDGGLASSKGGMAQLDGTMARDGTMAGDGGLAGDGLISGRGIISGNGIIAGKGLLAGDHGLTFKDRQRFQILKQQHSRDRVSKAVNGRGIFIENFVRPWKPWEKCHEAKKGNSQLLCSVEGLFGDAGADGVGDTAKYRFVPAVGVSLAQMPSQSKLFSTQLSEALEPLNEAQIILNNQRLVLVQMAMMEVQAARGQQLPANIYDFYNSGYRKDISGGNDGGFDAPYDINGDGQYLDNWGRVVGDYSIIQPSGGYIAPVGPPSSYDPPARWAIGPMAGPGGVPLPGAMAGPEAQQLGAGQAVLSGSNTQMLHVHGLEPDWTKSPWWSFFNNDSAKKIVARKDSWWPQGGPWLGDDDVEQTAQGLKGEHAGTHTAAGGLEYQYAKPTKDGAKKLGAQPQSGKGPWEPWLVGHGEVRKPRPVH